MAQTIKVNNPFLPWGPAKYESLTLIVESLIVLPSINLNDLHQFTIDH